MDDTEATSSLLKSTAKLIRLYDRNIISLDVFTQNLTAELVGKEFSTVSATCSLLGKEFAQEFTHAVISQLESSDFMPSPALFMTDIRDPATVKQKQIEMRPKYVTLVNYLEKHLENMD